MISPLATYTKISPNKTSPRNHDIDTITIHCVVGQCTVESLGAVFANPQRQASSNYGIGYDGKIACYVPEEDRAWTTGGSDAYGKPILVNGISGSMNDHRAITIEVASDTKPPYEVTYAAYNALVTLLVDICRRNPKIGKLKWMNDKSLVGNVNIQNMTAHRWFANKSCPGDYLFDRFDDIAARVNARVNTVTNNIQVPEEGDEDMTVERFKELFDEMRVDFRDNDAGQWSDEARAWAVENGLILGESATELNAMWEDLLTREQLVTILYRFAKLIGKA